MPEIIIENPDYVVTVTEVMISQYPTIHDDYGYEISDLMYGEIYELFARGGSNPDFSHPRPKKP